MKQKATTKNSLRDNKKPVRNVIWILLLVSFLLSFGAAGVLLLGELQAAGASLGSILL